MNGFQTLELEHNDIDGVIFTTWYFSGRLVKSQTSENQVGSGTMS